MSALPLARFITETEYLALEESADTKSEYLNGTIYAMAGASYPHIVISGNTFRELGNQLATSECEPYNSGMRVKISATGDYVYPDISVACKDKQFDLKKTATLLNPTVILEILSSSTEAFDRGEKFTHYQRIASLQQYVLISQSRIYVEVFTRNEKGWTYLPFDSLEAVIPLASIGCNLSLRAIYRGIQFVTLTEFIPASE